MTRIFSILSVLSIIMILVSGAGTYWISQSDIKYAKLKSTEATANAIALGISSRLSALQQTVSKMAATPNVIQAIESSNPILQTQAANQLEQLLPGVLKIRLLTASVRELDDSSIPHMGNADLLMAQETLNKSQLPAIQGQGENRHLAITAAVKKDNVTIGILLASLKYDFLQSTLKKSKLNSGFIDLKQGKISLASSGDKSNITDAKNKVSVSQSSWDVYYWSSFSANNDSITMIGGIILALVLLSSLIFFMCYKKVSQNLKQDQGSILKVVKDLMAGKHVGSYPVNFSEMKAIVSTIIQFKRVLDNDGKELSTDENSEIDDFFDEPTGISFLDIDQGINTDTDIDNSAFQSIESSPISLPGLEADKTINTPDAPSAYTPSLDSSSKKKT